MQIHCKSCDQEIAADDINIDKAIAKCSACNAVFGFGDLLPDGSDAMARPQRDPVPMPKAITIEDWGGNLIINRRWFSLGFVFLLFFCAAWDGFLVFWYKMAFADDAPLMMKIFPIGHLAVGVGLTYFTLAGFLNTTRITAGSSEVTVRHGPLPWLGNRTIPASDIEQLYCTEHTCRHSNETTSITYRVNAVLSGGKKAKLLSGLTDADQALYIEQTIENRLGIEDRRVRGEMNS